MIEEEKLAPYLLAKYPTVHTIKNDSQLYTYAQELKKRYLKKAPPLHKVFYDSNLSITHQALGLNTHKIFSHGKKQKTKKEIRIAAVFTHMPEDFLRMIVGHELAHLKESGHGKAFYSLCEHIVPDYHQIEFDLRCSLMLYAKDASLW